MYAKVKEMVAGAASLIFCLNAEPVPVSALITEKQFESMLIFHNILKHWYHKQGSDSSEN
jgi:hypothetical protein